MLPVQENKPRMKLSLGNFSEGGKLFNNDVFGRNSNIGETSQATDSTAAESMLSASGVRFSKLTEVVQINTGRRTSIANSLSIRRKTEQVKHLRPSNDSSLNDRESNASSNFKISASAVDT